MSAFWVPDIDDDDNDKEEDEFNPLRFVWMEGDSLAPPCQAELDVIDTILDFAGSIDPSDNVYDLGCGDGRICMRANSRFKCSASGVEIEPDLIEKFKEYISRIEDEEERGKVKAIQGDLREIDFSSATIIITYLLPDAMLEIEAMLVAALERGCRIICNTWGLASKKHFAETRCGNTRILLYK